MPIEIPLASILTPDPSFGVVVSPDVQAPNPPSTNAFKTDVVEVEDRVSSRKLAKHSPPRPSADRLTPASKNSPFSAPLLGVPLLSVNDHGMVMVLEFTRPQKASPAPADAQLAVVEVRRIRRLLSPQVPAVAPVVFLHVGSHL